METKVNHEKEFGLRKPITNLGIICAGNTSRSPTVATVLKSELERRGIAGVRVWSAGILNLPGASQANKITREFLAKTGYPEIGGHTPRFIESEETLADLRKADLILTMDPGQTLFLQTDVGAVVKGLPQKTFTLRGFITGRERELYNAGTKQSFLKMAESLRVDDPHWDPKTYRKRFSELVRLAKQLADIVEKTHQRR